jgi:hypothetical protein
MDAAPGGHIDGVARRVVKIINRNCPDRAIGKVRISAECGPRDTAVSGLIDANARFGIARRGVFTRPRIECVVRRVIG